MISSERQKTTHRILLSMMMVLLIIPMGKLRAGGANLIVRDPVNRGYGVAIGALLRIARAKNADIVVTLDSDGQHNPDQIPAVVEPIVRDGFDLVIGSRFLGNSDREKVPKYRSLGIKVYNQSNPLRIV